MNGVAVTAGLAAIAYPTVVAAGNAEPGSGGLTAALLRDGGDFLRGERLFGRGSGVLAGPRLVRLFQCAGNTLHHPGMTANRARDQ